MSINPTHPDGPRVARLLTERGIASRREADEWIAAGWVRVNGQLAVLGQRALPDARIEIDPRARREQARSITVLLNKPLGVVSGQAEDGHAPAITLIRPEAQWPEDPVRRPLPRSLPGLATAGRLDIDSTGLLVLTQDGRIARHLIGADSRVEKEYLVRVQPLAGRSPAPDLLARLGHGLVLDGVALKPARVSWANEDQLRFVLREGRKRQIRRMCELVGLQVLALKRVRIGSVVLGKLPSGQWRYLRDDERF
jgi:23S rRNA pseudouridine2604 synthase